MFKILKSQKGQLITTEIIILGAILTVIGIAFLFGLSPTMENTHEGLTGGVKKLKGGGM